MSRNSDKAVKEVAYLAEIGYAITLEPGLWRECCEDNPALVHFFVDSVMLSTKGKADKSIVQDLFAALSRVKSPNWK